MSQANKKQPAPKLAASSDKQEREQFSASDSARNSAQNVLRFGSSAMQDFFSSSAGEAQKAQEKLFSFGRESAENFAKSSDAASRVMYEAMGMSRDNMETCVECGNIAASLAKDVSAEMFESANRAFSDNVEMSREFFACRTLSDMFDLQNRAARSNIDSFFNQSMKYCNLFFEYSSEALEPINERVSQAGEKFSKAFSS